MTVRLAIKHTVPIVLQETSSTTTKKSHRHYFIVKKSLKYYLIDKVFIHHCIAYRPTAFCWILKNFSEIVSSSGHFRK